jgi:hypothetical protein
VLVQYVVGAERASVPGGQGGSSGGVEDRQPATRPDDPRELGQPCGQIWKVHHESRGEYDVDAVVGEREPARITEQQRREAGPAAVPCLGQHLGGDVETDDGPVRTGRHPERG